MVSSRGWGGAPSRHPDTPLFAKEQAYVSRGKPQFQVPSQSDQALSFFLGSDLAFLKICQPFDSGVLHARQILPLFVLYIAMTK
jgi:hypothetical protein